MRLASAAALERLKIERATSPRASNSGLPASGEMRAETSSRRRLSISEARTRMSARPNRGSRRIVSNARAALAMAFSISASPDTGISPTMRPS